MNLEDRVSSTLCILFRRSKARLLHFGDLWGSSPTDFMDTSLNAENYGPPNYIHKVIDVADANLEKMIFQKHQFVCLGEKECTYFTLQTRRQYSLEDLESIFEAINPSICRAITDANLHLKELQEAYAFNLGLFYLSQPSYEDFQKVHSITKKAMKEFQENATPHKILNMHIATQIFWKIASRARNNSKSVKATYLLGEKLGKELGIFAAHHFAVCNGDTSDTGLGIHGTYPDIVGLLENLLREPSPQLLKKFNMICQKLSDPRFYYAFCFPLGYDYPSLDEDVPTKDKETKIMLSDRKRLLRMRKFLHAETTSMDDYLKRFNGLLDREKCNPIDAVECSLVPAKEYTIVRKLGTGATKIVFEAKREGEQKKVAYKFVDISHLGIALSMIAGIDKKTYITRELRGVQASAAKSAYICKMIETIQERGRIIFVEEKFEQTLGNILIQTSVLDEKCATKYGVQLLDALAACHEIGIAHGDLKPDNIGIDSNGNIKLTDFGLANSIKAEFGEKILHIGSSATRAPELFDGRMLPSAESDIWAIGALLYCMVAGHFPFYYKRNIPFKQKIEYDRKVLRSIKRKVLWGNPRSMYTKTPISEPLQNILIRSMAYRPEDRFSSAREFKTRLEEHYSSLASQ